MFIGHFGVAFAAKRVAPTTSLGTLIAAAQLVDLLWPLFLVFGWEHVRIDPGNTIVTPLDFYDYPITHSLAGALGWSIAFGLIYFIATRKATGSYIVGACVGSHWVLDYATHRPDLPLFPGSSTYLGLGLWNSLAGTMTVELILFLGGVVLYLRSTRASGRAGTFALAGLVLLLLVSWFGNLFGPPPPDAGAMAIVGNAMWLFVLWGYWIDKNRQAKSQDR